MRTEDRLMSFQGMGVHFRVCTPDSGNVKHRALFVCSPGGDTENWTSLCDMLSAKDCLCVAVDLPGFGLSECPEGVKQDNDTRAQILWGILDEVEGQRNEQNSAWHLIGHGNGCAAVMTMSLYQPDSTLSQVLISPVLDRFTPLPIHKILCTALGRKCVGLWYKRNVLKKQRFRRLTTSLYGARLQKERVARLHRPLARPGALGALCALIRDGYAFPKEAYGGFGPVMLIWGAQDRIFGGQPPRRLTKRLPNAETHIVRAAHYCMETHPDMLRDYLCGWFRYTEGGESGVVKRAASGAPEAPARA